MTEQKPNKWLQTALYVLIALLAFNLIQLFFAKDQAPADAAATPLTLELTKDSYNIGSIVKLEIKNNTDRNLRLEYTCPDAPLTVWNTGVTPNVALNKEASAMLCDTVKDSDLNSFSLPAKSTKVLSYDYWTSALFNETGHYRIGGTFTIAGEKFQVSSNEFEIEERGFFSNIWYNLLYRPFYNLIAFFIKYLPGYSLAVGIIFITLLVRLILLVPSQKAMRSQKELQELQPKLEELRKKYKDNQQMLAQETMKLWKEHKVNPLGNCLPILIQIPLLLALFHVISNGINVSNSYVLYGFLADFDYGMIDTVLGNFLPLTEKNLYALPLIVGILQFLQMHLTFKKAKKTERKPGEQPPVFDLQASQGLMKYFLPVMIAVFTASVPAGVGLYWGISTLFAIVQQMFVNKTKKGDVGPVMEAEVIKA